MGAITARPEQAPRPILGSDHPSSRIEPHSEDVGHQTLGGRLGEAEAKYRTLVEQIPAVVYLGEYGPDGDWLYVSPQIERVLGYTADEWLAHPNPMTSCTHPEDLAAVREAEERSVRTGDDYRAECRMRSKDGRWMWILDEARPVRDAEGRILFMQGVMTDVTARREEEDSRVRLLSTLESERRLHGAMEDIHLACVSLDLDGRVTFCNRFLLRLTGWTAEETLGQDWWDLFSPEVCSEARARFLQDVRTGSLVGERDGAIQTRVGDRRCISWSDTLVRDAAGAIVAVTSIGRDVTDQRAAEDELRARERRFQALTENSHEVITLVGADGTIVFTTPSGERVLGYASEETLGSNALDYVHPEDLPQVAELFGEIAGGTAGSSRAEFRVRHGNGSWIWVETVAENRVDDPGISAIVLNTRDITERKLAEDRLREAEQKYRTIVEQLPAIVYADLIDGEDVASWPTVYISPQIEQILGYTPEEWIGDSELWARVVHPEDLDGALSEDERFLGSAQQAGHDQVRKTEPKDEETVEYRIFAKDGRLVWLRDHAVILRDQEGVPRFQQGILTDVTEVKRAEEQAREAEARYRSLVQNLPVGFYTEPANDIVGPTSFASPQLHVISGYRPEAWVEDPGLSLRIVHDEDHEAFMAAQHHAIETGDPFIEEYRIVRPDGSIVWVHDQAVLVRDEDGTPLRWEGFMIDVTARRTAEAGLREAEAKYRTLVERVPAVVYTDSEEPISATLYLSPQIETMTGYSANELLHDAELWRGVIHPDDFERQLAAELSAFETHAPYSIQYRLITRDGRTIWIDDRSAPVMDEDGRSLYWLGVMQDVTRLKETEAELERALGQERQITQRLRDLDEMKNTFLTAVSHELRTPLTSVLGSAMTLDRLDDALCPEDRRALVVAIANGTGKLDRLIRDLLDMDRLSRGVLSPQRSPVDLAQVAAHVLEESNLPSSREVVLAADAITASVDVAMVERVIENLLVNAARHTPAGTRIWIRVERQDEGVLLAVEDDGPGVPTESRVRIFDPFSRGPDVPSHAPGIGVGLALVGQFARLHGGRAWVEDRPGGGASFRVYLPDVGPGTTED